MQLLIGSKNQGAPQKEIRLYDFRSPDKFPKDQLRTLLLVHENFCRAATTSLSAVLRAAVQITPTLAEQCTYSSFVRGLKDPTVLGVISMPPLPGNGLMEMDNTFVFPVVDRLLGGPGTGVITDRAITEIEATVLRRVFKTLMDTLKDAWRSIADVSPRLEALETNPLFAQLVSPAEMVAFLTFSAEIGDQSGEIKLCLPYPMLEPILHKLSARHWLIKGGAPTPEARSALATGLADVSLPVSVEMGRAEITVGELLDLDIGDVIQLDTSADGPLDVYVNGRKKFRGRPGRAGRWAAVQITDLYEGSGGE
jgi:flagellar motor switch protein FliM